MRPPPARRHARSVLPWLIAAALLVAVGGLGLLHSHQAKPTADVAVLGVKIAAKTSTVAGCSVGQPCDLATATWTHTAGCTKAWLASMHLKACPIDSKTGRPYPLVG